MFETDQFRSQLESAIASEAGQRGMSRYQTSVVVFLQTLAENNETILFEAETHKAAGQRRGTAEALTSARDLVKVAASFASADHRTTLTLADMEAAYQAKYCQIWPFCR
jgi:hypothetical protein